MRYLIATLLVGLAVLGPNLVWLGTSTLRLEYAAEKSPGSVAYVACETRHSLGSMRAGDTVFRFLEACGDDTLEIVLDDNRYCQTYVEGELYHVDAVITGPDRVDCSYDDLLSSLFILKLF